MINTVIESIKEERRQLLNHSLYSKIKTPSDLQIFLEHHVFAVWDFMSLLKALQIKLTCTSLPWKPVGSPTTRYLINEIVLGEETDVDEKGVYMSHYEMYLQAMKECNVATHFIEDFVAKATTVEQVFERLDLAGIPSSVKDFLHFTFEVIEKGKLHEVAAVFTFGREDLIPEMFTAILKDIIKDHPDQNLSKLIYYFERHIEVDGDTHGPLAHKMVSELCGNDAEKWNDVIAISKEALVKRIALWDGIEKAIGNIK